MGEYSIHVTRPLKSHILEHHKVESQQKVHLADSAPIVVLKEDFEGLNQGVNALSVDDETALGDKRDEEVLLICLELSIDVLQAYLRNMNLPPKGSS